MAFIDTYAGEIRLFAGDFELDGFMFCDGRQLEVANYPALFSAIGTWYGGDGRTYFKLPDLRGRLIVHTQRDLGYTAGSERVALTVEQLPAHTHGLGAVSSTQNSASPAGNLTAGAAFNAYTASPPDAQLSPQAIGANAGGGAHDNLMPYVALNYQISVSGVDPAAVPARFSAGEAFVGEIRPFALSFAPRGWEPCDGRLKRISQNTTLFRWSTTGSAETASKPSRCPTSAPPRQSASETGRDSRRARSANAAARAKSR